MRKAKQRKGLLKPAHGPKVKRGLSVKFAQEDKLIRQRHQKRLKAADNQQKMNKLLGYSKWTLRINDENVDRQAIAFMQKEVRWRSKLLFYVLAFFNAILAICFIVLWEKALEFGLLHTGVLQASMLVASIIAIIGIKFSPDKFTALIGPLVFGFFTVSAVILMFSIDDAYTVNSIAN